MATPIDRLLDGLSRDLADPADLPGASEAVRGRIRARQVYAIARLTPAIMPANALNALAVVLVFAVAGEDLRLVSVWAAVAVAAAAWFGVAWLRRRDRPFPASLGPETTRRAVRYAALLGAIWAVPSVALMPYVSVLPQAFLVLVTAGMVSGGVACYYPIPRAAAAYTVFQIAAAVYGFANAEPAVLAGGLIVAASYLLVVRRVIAGHSEVFVSEIAARIELEEKTRRIEALMAQTEAEAQRIVRESARRLEQAQKMEALGQLTGGMAHDFNNTLTVIRGNAELMRAEGAGDAALTAEIVAATERGADVIQKLLAFSRRQALHPESADIAALCADVAAMLERILSERVAVETAAPPDLWRARADRAQLQAALVNLAVNARDAMPEGGRLEILCANLTLSSSEAAALSERVGHELEAGDWVRITVRDEGVGMSPETAARAFEPFFTTKPVGAGAGLGLSMVLGFIRQSGGFVTLDARPGAGASVALHLPRADAPPASPVPAPAEDCPRGAGETVLLVEDQPDVRRTLAAMLRDLGYAPVEAGDADAAEARLAVEPPPAVIVADVVLPGGATGLDLARRLQGRPGAPPVLLISGYPDLAFPASETAEPVGSAPHLRKPFSRGALARALRERIRKRD